MNRRVLLASVLAIVLALLGWLYFRPQELRTSHVTFMANGGVIVTIEQTWWEQAKNRCHALIGWPAPTPPDPGDPGSYALPDSK